MCSKHTSECLLPKHFTQIHSAYWIINTAISLFRSIGSSTITTTSTALSKAEYLPFFSSRWKEGEIDFHTLRPQSVARCIHSTHSWHALFPFVRLQTDPLSPTPWNPFHSYPLRNHLSVFFTLWPSLSAYSSYPAFEPWEIRQIRAWNILQSFGLDPSHQSDRLLRVVSRFARIRFYRHLW